ncbi:MFS transporter [Solwaraspora sp. WMMD1047]|uniref:MFS transporter n=1 Tax=Solwaraspora sp. WMMD1047 TaxID=3016102 RepID=UPI002416EEBE|nr:MFS transporter [Solwaraspora sp. WMMD1047]MDG4830826.1 MFS transporter [Solwaraspora sp. WMMD1047]
MTAVSEAPQRDAGAPVADRRDEQPDGPAKSDARPAARAALFAVWSAKAVASTGRTVSVVALPWFVLQITGSGTQTGLAVASSGLGIALVGFFAGALIDRTGAKRSSVGSLVIAGSAIGLVPLLFRLDVLALWQLLALVFVASALDSVASVAVEALVPDAARAARVSLESANAVLAAIDRFALLIMPVVAGVALALLGADTVLWVDTAACLVAAVLLLAVVPGRRRPDAPPAAQPAAAAGSAGAADTPAAAQADTATAPSGVRGYGRSLRDGLAVLWRDRLLVALTLVGTALNTLISSLYSIVLLAYAAEVFGSALHFAGMLAAVGGGALAGALLFAVVARRLPRRAWLLISCFGTAGTVLALAAIPGPVGTAVLMAASGLVMAPLGPLVATAFQERTPATALGRVLSARNALMLAGIPVGGLLAGVLLDVAGLTGTILVIGLLTAAVATVAVGLPALRGLDAPRRDSAVPA